MRFFYFYPTWNKPSGGNKQLRLAATLLTELGVETFLLRDQTFFAQSAGFDDDVYYGVPVRVAPFAFEEAGLYLGAEDVLVLPEVLLDTTLPVCRNWNCRVAVNNQNGFYGLRYGPRNRDAARRIEFAIANAPYVAALCKNYLPMPQERIFLIPHWVVRPPFELRDTRESKALAVSYMPRKLPEHVGQVRELVQRTDPDVPWVEIDRLAEVEVARVLRGNAVFFAAQDLEGCPLTALEAMACGCIVAGYPGTASFTHPYAHLANGFWAPDRNILAAADAVRAAIQAVRERERRVANLLDASRETVQRFSREVVLSALAEMIDVVRGRRYLSRQYSAPSLSWKENLFTFRLLYDYDRLGWPGRMLSHVSRWTKPLRRALFGARG